MLINTLLFAIKLAPKTEKCIYETDILIQFVQSDLHLSGFHYALKKRNNWGLKMRDKNGRIMKRNNREMDTVFHTIMVFSLFSKKVNKVFVN